MSTQNFNGFQYPTQTTTQPQYPTNQQILNTPQPTQYFPQPQGNIFMLNSSSETGNIPIGVGLSAGICLTEGTMYLKTLQNGAPMMLSYKLVPLDGAAPAEKEKTPSNSDKIIEYVKVLEDRISKLEEVIPKKERVGDKLQWN